MITERIGMKNEAMLTNSTSEADKLKRLSKRAGLFIAQFEVAQEKIEFWQQSASEWSLKQQQRVESQLAAIEKQSNAMAELMTDTGAALFRITAEKNLQQGKQHIEALDALFKNQQKNFESQQKKLDAIVGTHMSEMRSAESRVAKKIQNFVAQLNVEEMRELADTSRTAIEQTSAEAIFQSRKLLRRFHWKHITLVFTVMTFNTLLMGLYLSDEMPWEVHQHAAQERMAGQALLNSWPSLPEAIKHEILAHSKKNTHKRVS